MAVPLGVRTKRVKLERKEVLAREGEKLIKMVSQMMQLLAMTRPRVQP